MIKKNQPSRKKAVLTQAAGGYILTIIATVQGLFLLPLYLSYINVDTYGYWLTVNSILAIISIINFGIGPVAVQRMAKSYAQKEYDKVVLYFINSSFVYIFICVAFLLISFIVSYFLASILKIDQVNVEVIKNCFFIAMVTMLLTFLNQALMGFSNATLNPVFQLVTKIVSKLIGIAIVVILVLKEYGILSIPIGFFIAELITFIVSSGYLYKKLQEFSCSMKLDFSLIKEMVNFAPAVFSAKIGNKLFEQSPQILITNLIGAEFTTAYVVTRKIAEMILKIVRIFINSISSSFSNLISKEDSVKKKQVTSSVLFMTILFSFISFSFYIVLNESFVKLWIGKDISLGSDVITLIGAGTFVFSVLELFKFLHYGMGNFKYSSYLTLIGGILTLCLSLVLIPTFNILAIPLSYLISVSCVVGFSILNFFKNMELSVSITMLIKIIAFVVITTICYVFFQKTIVVENWFDFFFDLAFKFLLISILTILIYFNELKKAIYMVKGKK